ncbi:unnamed protein product [Owenia fusiformis]|uniref:UDP-glucose 4-epimerase n=1 Tax=Owenia fusiformis TaxID=6347 RepID=A0A8J1TZH8_OWEFU|nr:unnamed protein product [Owenia fusiformis]
MSGGGECVLVTGGTGYIGSHTVVELLDAGYKPVVLDSLVNSSETCIDRIEDITGHKVPFHHVDLLNQEDVDKVFDKYTFSCVIHFAGLKAVGESTKKPLKYYRNNVNGTLNLLESMQAHQVHNIIFSGSCTVYGEPQYVPLDEKHPVGGITSPYGKTKSIIEDILCELCNKDQRWNAVSLRYFNPVGAHKSGMIGEDPLGIPNNIMPFIAQVAVGKQPELKVFGQDYPTPDGTCIRDYVHVVELSKGHVAAINKLRERCSWKTYNLGTGKGYSVLELVKAFEKASGLVIPYSIVGRREGDVPQSYANSSLAREELTWQAVAHIDEMCEDVWRWQSRNPHGYHSPPAMTNGLDK